MTPGTIIAAGYPLIDSERQSLAKRIDAEIAMIAAEERERCAKLCDERAEACRMAGEQGGIDPIEGRILHEHLSEATAAIRAMGVER